MKSEWDSDVWEGPIRVAMGYPRGGWVQMAILATPRLKSVVVICSDVFNPFGGLKSFLKEISENDLPTSLTIEEEGPEKILTAYPSDIGEDCVEFIITDFDWRNLEDDRNSALLRCRIKRLDLVASFAQEITRWLEDGYDVNEFGGRYTDEPRPPEFDLRQLGFHDLCP